MFNLKTLLLMLQLVSEMSSAAGHPCDVDPALVNVLRSHKNGEDQIESVTVHKSYFIALY